jgi:hypothetical protein
METWLIVFITVGSGLALFIAIFIYKNKKEQRRNEAFANNQRVTIVGGQQQPQNFYPQHQGQVSYVTNAIPSTANTGIINHQNPQVYYNPNFPQNVHMHSGTVNNPMYNPRVTPMMMSSTPTGFVTPAGI